MKFKILKLLVPPSNFWMTMAILLCFYDFILNDRINYLVLISFVIFHFMSKLIEALQTLTGAVLAILALRMEK